MIIKSSTKEYVVNIYNSFSGIENICCTPNMFFVIDKKVYDLYHDVVFKNIPKEQMYLFEATEENKTIESALEICEILTMIPGKRNTRLISFGGGIVQDVTGFVANVLYRGISWTFYPTTLLAACDSCIGGKTSLNYKKYKNLLGTFYPPDEVNIYTPFFKTLSKMDYESGLGEVVKFNVMYGERGILNMEKNIESLLMRDDKKLEEFVYSSLHFKKKYIEEDEFDKGIRVYLNFAHTFGHAFETISNYTIPHGTAVAMGTIVANRISLARKELPNSLVSRIESLLCKIINIDLKLTDFNVLKIVDAIKKDKKQVDDRMTAVLLKKDMSLCIVHDIQTAEIEEAVIYMIELLGGC